MHLDKHMRFQIVSIIQNYTFDNEIILLYVFLLL